MTPEQIIIGALLFVVLVQQCRLGNHAHRLDQIERRLSKDPTVKHEPPLPDYVRWR